MHANKIYQFNHEKYNNNKIRIKVLGDWMMNCLTMDNENRPTMESFKKLTFLFFKFDVSWLDNIEPRFEQFDQ